jgi:cell division septation protein DedD
MNAQTKNHQTVIMIINQFRSILIPLLLLPFILLNATAQEYEEQALEILRLYEDGKTDTAYWLVEPLKRNARFVPVALYVRAQMTPDDRALGLYREVIALQPGGPYADDAAYQLVRRYTAKRDSLAAWTWLGMLESSFPQSPFIAVARELLGSQSVWTFTSGGSESDEMDSQDRTVDVVSSRSDADEPQDTEDSEINTGTSPQSTVEPSDEPATETPGSGEEVFSGYALQVGLLPTKGAAERRAAELRGEGLDPDIFEKSVDGRTAWAVVVGPYATREAAAADKGRVAKACGCGAFTVLVE